MKVKTSNINPKAAIPVLLFSFVFCLVIDNGFKTMTGPMASGLGINTNTASLQASLAGVIIGIGAVVYAALSDSIPIRKLMLVGVGFIVVGSLLGFFFSSSWPMVLTGRIIQTTGLAAAETLYVIYVRKHLKESDQKTYFGFSTAAYQSSMLIGALTSGILSTYVSWTFMFLVPLLVVFTVPFLLKNIPEDEAVAGHLDALGLFLIAVFAASLTMYMQAFAWKWAVPGVLGLVAFIVHVMKSREPLVTPEFFRTGRYVWAIILVFIVYSTYLGFIFMLPFAASEFHGLGQDQTAYLMIPGYICAIIVGIGSGAIGKVMSSRVAIITALAAIGGSLALCALFIKVSPIVLIVAIVFFASGFALLYAPLVNTALSTTPKVKSGIAIGFYNLIINISVPLGIAYTAKMQDLGLSYNAVLWVLAAIVAVGAGIYIVADRVMVGQEKRAGIVLNA